ncbi:MAG: hypothetical protein J6A21_07830, partial [Lentisphaeria bacterium]|nr:hypothetical protein [Lentisphaeria bacterium]
MKLHCFLASLLLLSGAALFAEEVKIDLANAVIVQKYKGEKKLAEDLKKHLDLMGSCDVKIVNKAPEGKYVFLLGEAPENAPKTLEPEEGRYLITDKVAYFYGDTFRDQGVKHAVYTFLEDSLGVKWPGREIVLEKRNPVIVSKREGKFVPVLNMRGIRGLGVWHGRMKMGAHNPPKYGHAFTKWWKRFGKEHPEYFALNYGKRRPTRLGVNTGDVAQALAPGVTEMIALCVSNEKVWDQIVEDWRKQGMPLYINLCENDAPDNLSCHCENCMKLDELDEAQKKDWTHA